MTKGKRQIIAEKISSTVRVLELLGLEYEVLPPKNTREKGNASPRVVHVRQGSKRIRVYNSYSGNTWANEGNGKPIASIKSVEDLFIYLSKQAR